MNRRKIIQAGWSACALSIGGASQANTEVPSGPAQLKIDAEKRAGINPQNSAFPPGNPRRYGAAGDKTHDDTESIRSCFRTLRPGVITPNYAMVFSNGQYRIRNSINVPNSASQFSVSAESQPRATQILWDGEEGEPMMRLINTREASISGIGFDRVGPKIASCCILQDRENATQVGKGGTGLMNYSDCRFAKAQSGVRIIQSGSDTNDSNSFNRCEFTGNSQFGLDINNTHAAWTDINECLFYSNGSADITNVVTKGQRRGGSYVARQCRHILGDVAYEVGASRSISIIAPRVEQQSCFIRTSAAKSRIDTLSASTRDNSFFDSGRSLPRLDAGEKIWVRGFSSANNNGVFTVASQNTDGRIHVEEPLSNEPAGSPIEIAATRCTTGMQKRGVHVMVFGGEILTNGPVSLLFDGDSAKHTLTLMNCDYQASGGRFEFPGAATINIIGGTYGLSEIRFNGRLNLIATTQAAQQLRLVNLGYGQLRCLENTGGGIENGIRTVTSESMPSADGCNVMLFDHQAPTSVSRLQHGYAGQELTVKAMTENTKLIPLSSGSNLQLASEKEVHLRAGQAMRFFKLSNGIWAEMSENAGRPSARWQAGDFVETRSISPEDSGRNDLSSVVATLISDLQARGIIS